MFTITVKSFTLGMILCFAGIAHAQDYSPQDDECVSKSGRVQWTRSAPASTLCLAGTRAETESEIACAAGKKFADETKSRSTVVQKCEKFSYDSELQNSCVKCGAEAVAAYWKKVRDSRRDTWHTVLNPKF